MADRTNIADGDDRVAIQVGHVGGNAKRERPERTAVEPGTAENIREDGATVGTQVDRIDGPLTIRR